MSPFLYPFGFVKDVCEQSAVSDVVLADDNVSVTRCCVDGISVCRRIIQVDDVSSNHVATCHSCDIRSREHRSETSANISTERNQIFVTALHLIDIQICLCRILVCPCSVADIANVVVVIERFSSAV